MSYVLEALRRAEADRHRGQVPDLHAAPQGGLGSVADTSPPAPQRRPALLAIAAAVVVAGGVGLWFIGSQRGGDPVVPAAPVAESATAQAAARPQPEVRRAPVPAEVPPPVALPAPARRALPAEPAAVAVAPPFSFGGAFDSPDPRARMLIINGQVWREGDEPVPGWTLERIALHAAQFRHQGRTVEVPYAGAGRRP